MKNCLFCKNTIIDNNDTCPNCHRVLVEKIGIPHKYQSQATQQKTKKLTGKHYKINFNQLSKNFNWNNFKKYIPILALILIIFFISTQKEKSPTYTNYNSAPISVIPDDQSNQKTLEEIFSNKEQSNPEIPTKNPINYNSLLNGKILSQNSYYLNGLGELKIKNGTSLDAIGKLVSMVSNKSVFTVYIKANSTYNISKVTDGNYKLFFNLGNDWDTDIKAFNVNSSYEVFEDDFNFTTAEYVEGDYIRTRYSTFEVTLNPVIGGHAETENVSAIEFANY